MYLLVDVFEVKIKYFVVEVKVLDVVELWDFGVFKWYMLLLSLIYCVCIQVCDDLVVMYIKWMNNFYCCVKDEMEWLWVCYCEKIEVIVVMLVDVIQVLDIYSSDMEVG